MTASVENKLGGHGRGALWLIALMLVGSAFVRFGAGPAAAIAREIESPPEMSVESPETPDISPQLVELLEQVRAREAALLEREAEMQARQQMLTLVEAEVTADIERLKSAEEALRSTMATADKAAETDIARLTSVYENMKPDQAAALFQRMKPSFAAGFLARMRADAAANILAGLEPDLAYSISVVMAGRNADVAREPVPE